MNSVLRRWSENYYLSRALSTVARPLGRANSAIANRLRVHVRRNGVAYELPNGRILRLARDSGIYLATGLFWRGLDFFEPATSRTLRFFFSRAATFVDIGANYGFYTLLAAHWNAQIQVVAFEPVPQIFEGLQRNVKVNRIGSHANAYRLAASDMTGRATLYVPASGTIDCASTATLEKDGWQERDGIAIEVETVCLDDFEEVHSMKVDLVKIDVEGHEASVLRGMQRLLRRDQPFVVCEILPKADHNERTAELINRLGYTAYWITVSGYMRVSNFNFERRKSHDFLLSPVRSDAEVVTDLETLWLERQAVLTV